MSVIDRMKSLFTTAGVAAELTFLGDVVEIEKVVEDGDRRVTSKLCVTFGAGLPKADDPVWLSLREVME